MRPCFIIVHTTCSLNFLGNQVQNDKCEQVEEVIRFHVTNISRVQMLNARIIHVSMHLLSHYKEITFYIILIVFVDGVIEFGIEGQELAIITYRDPVPIEVSYFSFASWFGVDLKVLYDCPTPGSETENSTLPGEKCFKFQI